MSNLPQTLFMPLAVAFCCGLTVAHAGLNPKILHGLATQGIGTQHNVQSLKIYQPDAPGWTATDQDRRLTIVTEDAEFIRIVLVGPLPPDCTLTLRPSQGKAVTTTSADAGNGLTALQVAGPYATIESAPPSACAEQFPPLVAIGITSSSKP